MIFTLDEWIQIIAGALGTFGFAVLFNVRGKRLLAGTIGGLLAWTVYVALGYVMDSPILRYFIVSVVTSTYSEVFARVMKTPRTTFLLICLIPLVPGSSLYYTMSYALDSSMGDFLSKALYTAELSAALALGIVVVAAISRSITAVQSKKRKKLLAEQAKENQ
ncbi:MAG: threonine/serine exporter family protein [Clostridia bacterium]|nr:threonine/serine exporter family protein [Clostridia bacterium]